MTKPAASDTAIEADFPTAFAPVQQSLERAHKASQALTSTYRATAVHQAEFIQAAVFDVLAEFRGLSRARGPEEFFTLSSEFAWTQSTRSLKALSDFYTGMIGCWSKAVTPAAERDGSKARPAA